MRAGQEERLPTPSIYDLSAPLYEAQFVVSIAHFTMANKIYREIKFLLRQLLNTILFKK